MCMSKLINPKYLTGKKIHSTSKSAKNVAEYVVSRLADIGVEHAFGIPGDYAFPIDKAIYKHSKIKPVLNNNERNAACAAS